MIVLEMMVDLSPLYVSLKTAIITIIITFFFGLFLAKWTLNRKHDLTKIILDGIFTMPLVLPPTVMGFFLLMIFGVNQPIGKLFFHVFHYIKADAGSDAAPKFNSIPFKPVQVPADRNNYRRTSTSLSFGRYSLTVSPSPNTWEVSMFTLIRPAAVFTSYW